MFQLIDRTFRIGVLALTVTAVAGCQTDGSDSPGAGQSAVREEPAPPTARQRVEAAHMLMHHGLVMASEGADLVMISELGMGPGLDEESVEHGRQIVASGRTLIERAGGVAAELDGVADPFALDFTDELDVAYLAVVEQLEGMPSLDPEAERHSVHHMHMLLNHALRTAVAGANLRMLGTPDRDASVVELSGNHGTQMIDNAEQLVEQVLSGPSMDQAHEEGLTGEPMTTAHSLAESIQIVIDLARQMPLPMTAN